MWIPPFILVVITDFLDMLMPNFQLLNFLYNAHSLVHAGFDWIYQHCFIFLQRFGNYAFISVLQRFFAWSLTLWLNVLQFDLYQHLGLISLPDKTLFSSLIPLTMSKSSRISDQDSHHRPLVATEPWKHALPGWRSTVGVRYIAHFKDVGQKN